MTDIPFTIEENVKAYGDHYAIRVPHRGRYLPIVLIGLIFLGLSSVVGSVIHRTYSEQGFSPDYWGLLIFGGFAVIFGVWLFASLKSIVGLVEIYLIPEERKIVLRRERTKKVVSEHAIDDVEIRTENVHHEDPSRLPMLWFTLFDTNRQKQIFAIRPTGAGGEGMAVGELEEFFNEVMRPAAKGNG